MTTTPTKTPSSFNPGRSEFFETQADVLQWGAVALGVITLGTGGYLFLSDQIEEAQEQQVEDDSSILGSPSNVATDLRFAFNPSEFEIFIDTDGTDEELVYRILRERVPNMKFWGKVQDKYRSKYDFSLDKALEIELTTEEREKAVQILNAKPQK